MTQTASPTLRVDIISDVVCPWCIIGYKQLEEAARACGASLDVHWHPYELNPQMPPKGQNLREHISEKYGTSAEDSARTRAMITQMGEELGFTFDFTPDSRIVNTLRAHKLILWADSKGRQHDMKIALIRRYFTEGEDISRDNVLLDAVEELGLDRAEAEVVLNNDALSEAIRQAEHAWMAHGIRGVPSMVFNRRHLVTGAQGVETYRQLITQLRETEAA